MKNNLYRDLAPITDAAWTEIELEATRTFKRHIAGRRVVDVSEPGGPVTAAVSTGRLVDVKAPSSRCGGPLTRKQTACAAAGSLHVVPLKIDDVERGAQDSDWDPIKAAAKKLAFDRRPRHLRGLSRRVHRRNPQSHLEPQAEVARRPASNSPTSSPRRCPRYGWPASTVRTRCCCPRMSTPKSARPPNMAIRSSNTSTGW